MSQEKSEQQRGSPIDISKINKGRNSFQVDWSRELEHPTRINGIPINAYAKKFERFENETHVALFFEKVILKDFKFANGQEKADIIQFLKDTFHQGCFLDPVSIAVAEAMQEKMRIQKWRGKELVDSEKIMPYGTIRNPDKLLDIISTPTGFMIAETMTAKKAVMSYDYMVNIGLDPKSEDPSFTLDLGKDYVIQAKGILELDFSNFSKNDQAPQVTVHENQLSYGNSVIKEKLEHRLYLMNLQAFNEALKKTTTTSDVSQQALVAQGRVLLKDIEDVLKQDPGALLKMSEILACSTIALENPQNKTNIDKLVTLAQDASKKESKFWKKLGGCLLMFVGAVLMVAGFAVAIVPFIANIGPLGAEMVKKGQTFWQEKGLHQSASAFKETVGQIKADSDVTAVRPISPDSGVGAGPNEEELESNSPSPSGAFR